MSGNAYNEALDSVVEIAKHREELSPEERNNIAIALGNLVALLAQHDEDPGDSTSRAFDK